jgi:hypothetical protein
MKTKIEKISENISGNKEISKYISSNNYYSVDNFINDAKRYIKAIKDRRMICNIASVSASGMSRSIKFVSCEHNAKYKTYSYQNYWSFFKAMGYSEARGNKDCFSIGGCGMDMIFHTNYSIIHRLCRLGFITKVECEKLCQQTPNII